MAKYTAEHKIAAVHRYLEGGESYAAIGESIGTYKSEIRNWVKQYEYNGAEAFEY